MKATIPQALNLFNSLPHAQKAAVITALYNGAPAFDPMTRADADLSFIVTEWVNSNAVPAEAIALGCAKAIAQNFAANIAPPPAPIAAEPPPPAAPTMPPVLTAAEHAAITRQALADARRAETSAQHDADAQARADAAARDAEIKRLSALSDAQALAAQQAAQALAAPSPIVIPQPAPVAAAPQPQRPLAAAIVTPAQPVALSVDTLPRSRGLVLARSLFADQPQSVTDRIPADLHIEYYAHSDAPPIDKDYAFDGKILASVLGAMACAPCFNLWLGGPRGTGKTEFARQMAGRLGRPFFRVNFNRSTDAEDILGGQGLRAGETLTVPGPVAVAARTEGALCLLDEITYAVTAHSAALNPILERDGAMARVPRTGERLIVAAGVCFMVADNTMGNGATSNEYSGRNPIGSDTLDRFGKFIAFDYLDAATERKVLRAMVARACGLRPSSDMAKAVCKIVAVCRAKADAGELEGAPSLRRAVAFCVSLAQGFEASDAYVDCIVNAAPQDSQEALRQIFAATWDHGNATPAGAAANPFADTAPAV